MSTPAEPQPVALVQMPWGAVSQPSIALGILKQVAKRAGFAADVEYLNIDFAGRLGYELYENISVRSALDPEWFFSSVLFGPDGLGRIDNAWADLASTETGAQLADRLVALTGSEERCRSIVHDVIPAFIDDCMARIDWSRYRVVGFTTTFAQTLSSLLLARHIKARHPAVNIVFGGANVDAEMGFELLKGFEWVDYVVHGEAEEVFGPLLQRIHDGRQARRLPGVSLRDGDTVVAGFADSLMLRDLNESPVPDYSDYFAQAQQSQLDRAVQVQVPFESSRGCWWGAKSHCTFCGLNRDSMAFRKKTPDRVYAELMELASSYRCLAFNATDNIIDMDYFRELLPRLAEAEVDFQLFYEVKANLRKDQIQKLAAAGVEQIQPGIESLNSEVLRLMKKGVTAIQNVQLLKWCFEYDVEPSWNILYGFPGERASHYDELARLCRLISHLPPPAGMTPVLFERFSPYHFNAASFGLALTPFAIYRLLYPADAVDYNRLAYYFDGQWKSDDEPTQYIQPALRAYSQWMTSWLQNDVLFFYERGPGFAILHDNRPMDEGGEAQARKIVLDDLQSRIYLFCDGIQSQRAIQEMLGDAMPPEDTQFLLDQFVDNGLMFREGDRYLSLAVRSRSAPRQRRTKRQSDD